MTDQVRFEHAERVRDFYRNQGAVKEQQRIIELLEDQLSCSCETPVSHAIAIIKGETK
jgi:hypothetical protein